MGNWYAIVTSPRSEFDTKGRIATLIGGGASTTFLPFTWVKTGAKWLSKRQREEAPRVKQPVYRRYVFAELHADDIGAVKQLRGVEDFVSMGGKAERIPDRLMFKE